MHFTFQNKKISADKIKKKIASDVYISEIKEFKMKKKKHTYIVHVNN